MSELVIDARVLVHRVAVGLTDTNDPKEFDALEARLRGAVTLVTPACEFLRSHRMLKALGKQGYLTPSEVLRLSMLICESGVELRPLWPWDVPRVSSLNCHPSDAWCITIAEGLGAPFLTLNPALAQIGATCPVEVY